jgi:dTDP-4-amino-4,6-dideoxygalactose transaminase
MRVNSRLDPIQAAVLRAKLPYLDDWTARRRAIALTYNEGLSDIGLNLPQVPDWADPVWHLYVVRSSERDGLQERLAKVGIGTSIHYPIAPHMQTAYADLQIARDALPLACDLAEQVISLPIGPNLALEDAARIVGFLRLGAS